MNQYAEHGDIESSVGNEFFTILGNAENSGKATGIVTLARLTHATSAACCAHVEDRGREE